MRIESAVRRDPAAFERLFRLLAGGSMSALDQAGVVLRLNTVVLIENTPSEGVRASLQHVQPAADGAPIRLATVPRTGWSRKD